MAKQNTIEHDKTFMLADLLQCEPWAALGLMEAFWDYVGRTAMDGDLTGKPLSRIADGVKWKGDPARLMHLLRVCQIVEELPGGILYVHDYHDHAPEMFRKRLAGQGKNFANGFPAHKPKVGNQHSYELAGWTKPEPVPYVPASDAPTSPQLVEDPPEPPVPTRRRRVADSPKAEVSDPPGESATSPGTVLARAEAHPIPSHKEELINTQDLIGGDGGKNAVDGLAAPAAAEPVVPLGSPSAREPEPALPPVADRPDIASMIERERREGETDTQVRQRILNRLRQEKAVEDPVGMSSAGARAREAVGG